jgi:hypothetical protein
MLKHSFALRLSEARFLRLRLFCVRSCASKVVQLHIELVPIKHILAHFEVTASTVACSTVASSSDVKCVEVFAASETTHLRRRFRSFFPPITEEGYLWCFGARLSASMSIAPAPAAVMWKAICDHVNGATTSDAEHFRTTFQAYGEVLQLHAQPAPNPLTFEQVWLDFQSSPCSFVCAFPSD